MPRAVAREAVIEKIGAAASDCDAASERARRAALGQFFTPPAIAAFMAGLFPARRLEEVRLLDAGAGVGALTTAFLRRVEAGEFGAPRVSAAAYEIDPRVLADLNLNLSTFPSVQVDVRDCDFIFDCASRLRADDRQAFTHAILNPPYKKISSQSPERLALRSVGIEAVNLYAAFVSLALLSMEKGGLVCAIVPRSFCNGPYYRPFRKLVLAQAALRKIHVFDARNRAFADDAVLQENVILLIERGGEQGDVQISASTDHSFSDFMTRRVAFSQVVRPGDSEEMFHIPPMAGGDYGLPFRATLSELGVQVSTGPIVDFRLKAHLRSAPTDETVPLLYPGHFGDAGCRWPYGNSRKPAAVVDNEHTRKWLYPAGNYTVVRRLSSKEERRRVVANTLMHDRISTDWVGFENHLNIFHSERAGLTKYVAFGLMAYLNSSMVDAHFRAFSGHTQVNATDLRALSYPEKDLLVRIGKWAANKSERLSQGMIDKYLAGVA
jgi:hypothetical protein